MRAIDVTFRALDNLSKFVLKLAPFLIGKPYSVRNGLFKCVQSFIIYFIHDMELSRSEFIYGKRK